MNNHPLNRLTTTGLTTAFGTAVFLLSSLTSSIASSPNHDVNGGQGPETTSSQAQPNSRVVSLNRNQADAIATVYSHQWQGQPAATLRIREIPVLTFLDSVSGAASTTENSATVRAQAIALRLNQLSQDSNFNAQDIKASWSEQRQAYSINIGSEELLLINQQTILPDTTRNLTADTLQVTNRLRRLLGNAEPIAQIAGKSPEMRVARGVKSRVKGNRKGVASWYGPGFHGRRTANGERFNQHGLTAAHRSLPFGTRVRVTNLRNGRSVVVRINDRGPFSGGRIIDLSAGAARAIGLLGSGVGSVQLEVLGR